jgi:hypothetical protein
MTTTFPDLQSTLSDCLTDKSLQLQVKSLGTQISIVINRPKDKGKVNYQGVSEILLTKLRSLNLPDINSVKLYGRMANTQQIEWQTVKPLAVEVSKPVVSTPIATNSVFPQKGRLDREEGKPKSKFQSYLEQFSHYSNVISAASLLGVLLVLLGFTTLASQRMQEERIEKKRIEEKVVVWEYQIKNVGDTSFMEEMNQQGELGWDLVFARRAKDSGDTFAYECIFKRVKK